MGEDKATGLVGKLVEIMGEVERVEKTRVTHSGPRFSYASIDDVIDLVRPEMVKHGVFLLSSVESVRERTFDGKNGQIALVAVAVKFKVIDANSADELKFRMDGEAMDAGDKALSKAITAAEKKALLTLFLLPTGDPPSSGYGGQVPPGVDPETGEVQTISEGQVKNLRGMLAETETDEQNLLAAYGLNSLEEMTRPVFFQEVLPEMKRRKREKAEG